MHGVYLICDTDAFYFQQYLLYRVMFVWKSVLCLHIAEQTSCFRTLFKCIA